MGEQENVSLKQSSLKTGGITYEEKYCADIINSADGQLNDRDYINYTHRYYGD